MRIEGNIVDVLNHRVFPGLIEVYKGRIKRIEETDGHYDRFIMPGFVDAHIHIESSMLVPSEFARIAVKHGTVATVSDPHEIANVLGVEGVEFMIENGNKTPFKFNFGAPSCVPATGFETAGAEIGPDEIRGLLERDEIKYLAEMMNYPGVIHDDVDVHRKISISKSLGKPVDGHAPGLRGDELTRYISAGISTDHECFTQEEAFEKLSKGMKVIIREGSAAKNFEALIGLANEHYQNMMFCSDDKHPDDLLLGHINDLCARALQRGVSLFKVLEMACINPVNHYGLDVGQLRLGDMADFIVVRDLENFSVESTYINGKCVFDRGKSYIEPQEFDLPNAFSTGFKSESDFRLVSDSEKVRVIVARDGELITDSKEGRANLKAGNLVSNLEDDILKITVVNRYSDQEPAIAFIKNFGLREGAIASSVGHDSHNIIAVGANDEMLCKAVNTIIENKGGICVISGDNSLVLPLPVAGIMSDRGAEWVGEKYAELDKKAKALGSRLRAPFMTLSFMALLVIPSLKLSDLGLFDGKDFEFTDVLI